MSNTSNPPGLPARLPVGWENPVSSRMMTETKKDEFRWILHYDHVVAASPAPESLEEHQGFVIRTKPPAEVPTRLTAMRYLTPGEVDMLPASVRAAGALYGQARAAANRAWVAANRAENNLAGAEAYHVEAAANLAHAEYIRTLEQHEGEMKVLHAKVCVSCPQNEH